MKRILGILFSMEVMVTLLVIFVAAIGAATFIENDYGTLAARRMVYNALWFEILMFLMGINLLGSIFTRKLYLRDKLPVFVFHLSFIIILLGAAITRYIGYEGSMRIREGNSSSTLQREGASFRAWVDGREEDAVEVNLTYKNPARVDFSKNLEVDGQEVLIQKTGFVPNAAESIQEDPSGEPILALILLKPSGREQIFLRNNDQAGNSELSLSFNMDGRPAMVNLKLEGGRLTLVSDSLLYIREMTSPADSLLAPGESHPLMERTIYRIGEQRFVLQRFYPAASIKLVPSTPSNNRMMLMDALQVRVTTGGFSRDVDLLGKDGAEGIRVSLPIGGETLHLAYGSVAQILPFSVYLHDFQLERYPGSNSPSSYASEVTLIDRESNVEKDFRIYMNNILKYKGFRFYQSSYDQDEKGTILSVNHDLPGTVVTYIGYFLLVAGMVMTLFTRQSRFGQLIRKSVRLNNGGKKAAMLALILLTAGSAAFAQMPGQPLLPPKEEARKFAELLVQERGGRIQPVNTLASDIVHKLTRRDRFNGWHPAQIFLGMHLDPAGWQSADMIKISNPELKTYLGVSGSYASFTDFFTTDQNRQYRLAEYVDRAYAKSPGQRDKFDKEIIDVDERVNIVYMIYTGQFLRVFPLEGDPNHTWFTPDQAGRFAGTEDSLFVANGLNMYYTAFREGMQSGNFAGADQMLDYIRTYQEQKASIDIPGKFKTRLEIMYYEWNIFKRLFPFYGLVGLVFLVFLLAHVVIPRFPIGYLSKGAQLLLFAGFMLHTLGLAARWYISGHAPWSNGFESMIYVAWATMLAGFLFVRRSKITLAATAILATLTLFVAHLSWMNPEITNLVPVLQSYWLTLHVSIITASYGFLGLSAVLGLVNLCLYLLKNSRNRVRVDQQVSELTTVSELSILLGLVFMTTGTLLGAVWANESWGRYWGWDPKETWSLVTIMVYTFITHMRLIPGMRSTYNFNLAAIVGFSSVLMTYFGVNYYLSGLHSYAAGDPVPIPAFVYYTIAIITLLAVFAWFNQKRYQTNESPAA